MQNKRIRITPTQAEILNRVEIPETIFEVFEDTEDLAGKYSEEEIGSYCAQLREQFASGFLDFSQFENQALLIEILADCTSGSVVLYQNEYESNQLQSAWIRSARNLEDKFESIGVLTREINEDGSTPLGKIPEIRGT